jgi:hypothetical protein
LVGDGVFVEESVVFFHQRLAEFGGEGGCFDAEAVVLQVSTCLKLVM